MLKQNQPKITTARSHPFDPIGPVAAEISKEAWLLCFDEFQVNNLFGVNYFSLCQSYVLMRSNFILCSVFY